MLTAATALGGLVIGGPAGAAIGALIPSVIQAGCEIVNDENATYYSHFFYLDGTSKLSYVSNSGADSYDDNDSAIENEIEDVKDKVEDIAGNVKDKMAVFGQKVGAFFKKIGGYAVAIAACALGVGALFFIIKLLVKFWKNGDMHIALKITLTVVISAATLALFYFVGYKIIYSWVIKLIG